MVYNALSYRRWLRWPLSTLRHARWVRGALDSKPSSSASERAAYDADAEGNAAPETTFWSRNELRGIMTNWSIAVLRLENYWGRGAA